MRRRRLRLRRRSRVVLPTVNPEQKQTEKLPEEVPLEEVVDIPPIAQGFIYTPMQQLGSMYPQPYAFQTKDGGIAFPASRFDFPVVRI